MGNVVFAYKHHLRLITIMPFHLQMLKTTSQKYRHTFVIQKVHCNEIRISQLTASEAPQQVPTQ
jgi:hypothetical protein